MEPGGIDLSIEPVAYGPLVLTADRRPGQPVPRARSASRRPTAARGPGGSSGTSPTRQRPGSSLAAVRLSLQPSLDPAAYRFVHHVRTRFAETDAMGVIHHGTYPAYLEEARAAMLRDAGFPYEEVRAGDGRGRLRRARALRPPPPAPALRRPGRRPRAWWTT